MENRYKLIKLQPFEDMRGKLLKIAAKSKMEEYPIEEVYILYSIHGAARGNHYHNKTVEIFSVLSGKAKILLKDLHTGEIEVLYICGEDNAAIFVPEQIVHAFVNIGEEPLIMAAISSREYNPEDNDTIIDYIFV